ncbi:MAG TPA: hypothetical protein VK540_29435 [Polyangiaceae bacterium]|nr:hypothetical protein [Polyangiaceae bacterium]
MRRTFAVTTCKIIVGAGATFAAMSAAGCGATDSSCIELQRTCSCDSRKPCPDDGAVGKGGASAGGAGGIAGADASDETDPVADGAVEAGSGGKSGAAGSGGGTTGGSGAGGRSGAGGAGGSRDAATTESGVDAGVDVDDDTGDVAIDASADGGNALDAADANNVADAGFDAETADIGPTCDVTKSPSAEPCLVDEQYGLFVSPVGDDFTGSGTRIAPYATIGKALQAAVGQNLRVYACEDGNSYPEQLVVPDGAKLFGGFECYDWTYSAARRVVVHAPASPALAIHGASTGVLIEDVDIDAPDAVGLGTTSLGALIDGSSNVVLRRVTIAAGKGGEGAAGTNGAPGADAPDVIAGLEGTAGMCPATVPAQLGGAWVQATTCGSRGGGGGTAMQGGDGTNGVAGNPRDNVAPPDVDNGGLKGPTGGDGIAGSPGRVGFAGVATSMPGMFTSAGFTPSSASQAATGGEGNVGQGGGGGAASNAIALCIGASGGAGGMGGCGGLGGLGGAGGGASVALLSWTSVVTLESCDLVAHGGGQGGKGGSGGPGGSGKSGALGGEAFVADGGTVVGNGGRGGTGGTGGIGGPGAGGAGGPSYALVYKGQSPIKTTVTLTAGAGGLGGLGGTSGSTTASGGNAGQAAPEFPVP